MPDAPATQEGIKETMEVIDALAMLTVAMVMVFKDGVQLSDVTQLWDAIAKDPVAKALLERAWENYKKIPAELKNLDASEYVQIGTRFLLMIPSILDALKKDAQKAA